MELIGSTVDNRIVEDSEKMIIKFVRKFNRTGCSRGTLYNYCIMQSEVNPGSDLLKGM